MTILLVDDDPGFTRTTTALLEAEGYRVHPVTSYAAAHEKLAAGPPDVLITDVRLDEGLSGWTLVQLARERYPELPILVVTGFADAHTYHESHRYRTPVLLKPFDFPELLAAVGAVSGEGSRRRGSR